MRPLIVFAGCSCVSKTQVSIQALLQESFDGELVHFKMVCLYCNCECLIAEPFENYADLKLCEEEVMLFLDKPESQHLLDFALSGVTYSKSPKYKEQKYLRKGGHNETK